MQLKPSDIPKVAELLKNGGSCPSCGYLYKKQPYRYYDSDNGTLHRRFHRQHVPVPESRLSDFPAGDIRVDITSPAWLHQLVWQRAKYLQQQEHYDFTQWNAERGLPDTESSKNIHAILLTEDPNLIVGAASFSWTLWTNYAPSWNLNFVWIAGTWRRKGVLSKRWPAWLQTYGAFTVESPWSDAMWAFLLKMGPPNPVQAEWLKTRK